MNKHILMVIDNQLNPGKYTQEELDKNCNDAFDAYAAANAAASYATYRLNIYFKHAGENKQDYIDAINKDKL